MSSAILIPPPVVAVVLIVYDRVNHRRRRVDRIAVARHAAPAVAIDVAPVTLGRWR